MPNALEILNATLELTQMDSLNQCTQFQLTQIKRPTIYSWADVNATGEKNSL